MYSHERQRIPPLQNVNTINSSQIVRIELVLVPFTLIRCARGGGVSEDIENVSLDVLAQKRLDQGKMNF